MSIFNTANQPYLDALSCFQNGHVLIPAFRKKYGYSYRQAVEHALNTMHEENRPMVVKVNKNGKT